MNCSPLMAFRSAVMIVCLVTVPLAAVLRTSLTSLVNRVAHEHDLAAANRSGDGRTQASETQPGTLARAAADAMGRADRIRRSNSAGEQGRRAPAVAITSVRAVPAGVEAAPFWSEQGMSRAAVASAQRAAYDVPLRTGEGAPGQGPAAGEPVLQSTGWSQPVVSQGEGPASAGRRFRGQVPDAFSTIESRLRELGAVRYRLETWGDQGDLYRFYCQVPVEAGGLSRQHFEAVDPNPLLAAGKVLDQVQAWLQGQ